MRSGQGICLLRSGAIYKGEWRDDKPHGHGILYSGSGEILETKFDKGNIFGSEIVKQGFGNNS